jgi:hypothetical protein
MQFSVSAQDSIESNHCLTRSDLLQLVHLPVSDPNSTELMDMLDAKGYLFGSNITTMRDTLNAIVMEYDCHVYYDNIAGRLVPTVHILESKDGLPNIIMLNLSNNRDCANQLANDFHQGGYLYDGQRGLYSGRDGLENQMGTYEALYNDGAEIKILFRKQNEIDNFVRQQIQERTTKINQLMSDARTQANNQNFYNAYQIVDSAMGLYLPMDSSLTVLRGQILESHIAKHLESLREAVNQKEDFIEGIAFCDSLLALIPDNDSILRIRQELSNQQSGQRQKYSVLAPEYFKQVTDALDSILNQEIRLYPDKKKQTIDLHFEFTTTNENLSSGKITLDTDRGFFQSKSGENSRNQRLQAQIDNLASSDLIHPVYEFGIVVNTHEVLDAKIEWRYNSLEITGDDKSSAEMQSYIDTIVENYFKVLDPSRTDNVLTRMPYRREYTFGITRKQCNDESASDVLLTNFSTSSILSWMPSLFVPGLGTVTQGYRTSVSSRAFPFFLFGGLAIAGYFIENNGHEKTSWNDGGVLWDHKNFGNILLYAGATISTTIYITDLVQSIKATFSNRARSKKLRKALKEGPITIRMEDIHIQ